MAVGLILRAFGLALGQLDDPQFRRVFFLGVGLSVALLIAATAGVVWLTQAFTPEDIWLPLLGDVRWVDDLLSWGAAILLMALSIFLMIPVASAITSFFLDDVAEAVEARHFPDLPPVRGVPWGEALRDTVNFLGVLIAANVFAFALYVFLPFAAPLIFWAVNGFLLGREYFTLVAIRWVGRQEAKTLRRRFRGTIWLAGTLMAIPLTVPLLNLVIPILGAATFTHLYHGLTRRRPETSFPRRRP